MNEIRLELKKIKLKIKELEKIGEERLLKLRLYKSIIDDQIKEISNLKKSISKDNEHN